MRSLPRLPRATSPSPISVLGAPLPTQNCHLLPWGSPFVCIPRRHLGSRGVCDAPTNLSGTVWSPDPLRAQKFSPGLNFFPGGKVLSACTAVIANAGTEKCTPLTGGENSSELACPSLRPQSQSPGRLAGARSTNTSGLPVAGRGRKGSRPRPGLRWLGSSASSSSSDPAPLLTPLTPPLTLFPFCRDRSHKAGGAEAQGGAEEAGHGGGGGPAAPPGRPPRAAGPGSQC